MGDVRMEVLFAYFENFGTIFSLIYYVRNI